MSVARPRADRAAPEPASGWGTRSRVVTTRPTSGCDRRGREKPRLAVRSRGSMTSESRAPIRRSRPTVVAIVPAIVDRIFGPLRGGAGRCMAPATVSRAPDVRDGGPRCTQSASDAGRADVAEGAVRAGQVVGRARSPAPMPAAAWAIRSRARASRLGRPGQNRRPGLEWSARHRAAPGHRLMHRADLELEDRARSRALAGSRTSDDVVGDRLSSGEHPERRHDVWSVR